MEKLYIKFLDLSERELTKQIVNKAKTVGELIFRDREFVNQLTVALRRNQTLTHLNFSLTTINDKIVSVLSEKDTITHLDLSHIYFRKGWIEKIVKNKNLQYLTIIPAVVKFNSLELGKFPLEVYEIVKEVSTFLQETTSLKYLNFSNIKEPPKKIFKALLINRSLTDLKLASNDIDVDCIQELTEMIKHNKTLQRLDLSRNYLNNAAVKEIAQALLQNQTLTDINLSYNDISPDADAREFITLFLQNKNLIALNLSYNHLGDDALSEIATQLSQTKLTKLSIADDMGLSLINQFASSLEHNNTLSSLSLGINLNDDEAYGWGDITDQGLGPVAVQKLTTALMTNQVLTFLDFSFYSMGPDGGKDVAEFLKHNKTLTDLNVSYNNIDKEGAKCIASALVLNKSLLNLNLEFNDIGTDGAVALWKALKVNRTLINLNISFFPPNNLVGIGINDLVDVLRSNNILTTLDIGGYETDTVIAELTEAVKENRTLLHLQLFPKGYYMFPGEQVQCRLQRNRNLLRKLSSIAKYVYTHRTQQELILNIISKKDLEEFEAYQGRHSMIKMLCESDFCVTEAAKVIDYTHYFIKNHFFVIAGILEDPFSKLPLDILCNIASYLKLKDVRE